MIRIRPAAMAGTFYPRDAQTLRAQVDACLQAAAAPESAVQPKMLVVPHAGYVYSGPIAGHAYEQLRPWARSLRRVVLLGPAHRVAVEGLAAPAADAFESPLGPVPIDQLAIEPLLALPQVRRDDRAHAQEHSLEVQLPFLQAVLGRGFQLVPLVVGRARARDVAEVLERLWGGDETLIVISTDLSHYLSAEAAEPMDRITAARIAALVSDIDPHEACGAHALNGALLAAREHGLQAQVLDLRHSGDTAGDRRRVVGYAALALRPASAAQTMPDEALAIGQALLARAHNSIARALGQPTEPEPDHSALAERGATFVTLHDARGKLRGCIGRLEAVDTLDADVRHNAAAAAFRDPRFAPLGSDEWPGLRIEVSVLEPASPLPAAASLGAAAALLQPRQDGVILEWSGHRSTFLPQVWDQLPRAQDFLAALLRKADLPETFWSPEIRLQRYRVRKYERAPVRPARRVLS